MECGIWGQARQVWESGHWKNDRKQGGDQSNVVIGFLSYWLIKVSNC